VPVPWNVRYFSVCHFQYTPPPDKAGSPPLGGNLVMYSILTRKYKTRVEVTVKLLVTTVRSFRSLFFRSTSWASLTPRRCWTPRITYWRAEPFGLTRPWTVGRTQRLSKWLANYLLRWYKKRNNHCPSDMFLFVLGNLRKMTTILQPLRESTISLFYLFIIFYCLKINCINVGTGFWGQHTYKDWSLLKSNLLSNF